MTTGRINQVTIVRRGRPTARIAGWKSSLVTVVGGAREAHREAAQLVRQGRSRRGPHPLPPSGFPRAPSAGGRETRSIPRAPPKRPKRRPCLKARPETGFASWRVPPVAFGKSGQRPGAHIAHPATHMGYSLAPIGSSQMPPPTGLAMWGTGQRWFSPHPSTPDREKSGHLAEAAIQEMGQASFAGCRGKVPSRKPGIQPPGFLPSHRCTEGGAESGTAGVAFDRLLEFRQIHLYEKSKRSTHGRFICMRIPKVDSRPPAAFFFFPSYRCTEGGAGSRTARVAFGRLLEFRQIHLYGVFKRSTHGHQIRPPAPPHPKTYHRPAQPKRPSPLAPKNLPPTCIPKTTKSISHRQNDQVFFAYPKTYHRPASRKRPSLFPIPRNLPPSTQKLTTDLHHRNDQVFFPYPKTYHRPASQK